MEIPIASRQFLDPSIPVSKASLLVYADSLLFFDWKWNFCLTMNEDPGSLADRISVVVSRESLYTRIYFMVDDNGEFLYGSL